MKTLLTLVLVTLTCLLLHISAGPVAPGLVLRGSCCPRVQQQGIPKHLVKNMKETPDHCKPKAVVVTDTTNKMFCIDASLPWTKKRLAEQKSAGQKVGVV